MRRWVRKKLHRESSNQPIKIEKKGPQANPPSVSRSNSSLLESPPIRTSNNLLSGECSVSESDSESLLDRAFDFDFIVIGSGFGGSVAALRLAEKGYRVAVMEMGRRWTADTLPPNSWYLHRWFWRPKLLLRGFFSMQYFRHVTVLHGCAVGGGSITYATTLLRPPAKVWHSGPWADLADWNNDMPQFYDAASRMLGVVENKILAPADELLRKAAAACGAAATFYRTHVAIFQGLEGEMGGQACGDPFFGGEGSARTTCTGCGGCMMGCRYRSEEHT